MSGTRSLSFDSVRGGRTILFGLWVISEGNGHTADRLVIYQNGDRIAGFSINELKAMGLQPIGLDKYLE